MAAQSKSADTCFRNAQRPERNAVQSKDAVTTDATLIASAPPSTAARRSGSMKPLPLVRRASAQDACAYSRGAQHPERNEVKSKDAAIYI